MTPRQIARAKAQIASDRTHERWVVKTYGLQPGEYAQILEDQGGRCAICMNIPRKRRLAVDHDHETGYVRALLCYNCNHLLLRFIEGNPIACHNASVYLADIAKSFGAIYDPFQSVQSLVPHG